MRKLLLAFLCAILIAGQIAPPVASQSADTEKVLTKDEEVLTKVATIHGTQYTVRVNTSNHTVSVSAVHLADNETLAGYEVTLGREQLVNVGWRASKGETHHFESNLMYHYDASRRIRNISLNTYGGSIDLTYNYTVPRKHEGRYLQPTITDTEFERVNRSWGRIRITMRSDAPYFYGAYVLVWVPDAEVRHRNMARDRGENVTRATILVPLDEGEPFEGEIRLHPLNVSKSSPLHTQYTFYGQPGNVSLNEVPYEPISQEEFASYSYENETESESGDVSGELTSGSLVRLVVGALAVFVVVLVVVGVLAGYRR